MNKVKLKNLFFSTALSLLTLGALPEIASAHHSFAMYDMTVTKTLTGKVYRFIPGGNHAQILFEVLDDQGEVVMGDDGKPLIWGMETGPSAVIARAGVTVKAFPVGTVITVEVNPLRNGKPFGFQYGGIIKCGMEFPAGGCTRESGEILMEGRRFGPGGPPPGNP